MPATITIASTISASDTVTSLLNKTVSVSSTCTMVDYSTSFQVTSTPASLLLPITPLQVAYIKNIGTVNVQITWTPNAGSPAVVQTLTPNSFLFVLQNSTGQGITAISVQTASSTSKIEYVVGG